MNFKINKNIITTIDNEDYEKISEVKWYAVKRKNNNKFYVQSNKYGLLHRFIMNITNSKIQIDHINGNTLDNRKQNLRTCTNSQNMQNRGKYKTNKSGYRGVSWDKNRNKWVVRIKVNNVYLYGGRFDNVIEAAEIYDKMALKYFKEFAFLNFKENK